MVRAAHNGEQLGRAPMVPTMAPHKDALCVQQPRGFKQHDGSMSSQGLGGLFPFLPFKGTEARVGLATALGEMLQGPQQKPTSLGGLEGQASSKEQVSKLLGSKAGPCGSEPADQCAGGSCGEGMMKHFGRGQHSSLF